MNFTPPKPRIDPPKINDWSKLKDIELSAKSKAYVEKWEKIE